MLIGAASSGSGKTTFTLGLLHVLKKRGCRVQPFKCGPDYIDTQYHTMVAGCASVNLDTWLASEDHVKQLYARYGAEADVCVTEGVMGLFDGYDGMHGSSAEIACLLHIPVILVLNARSMAYSAAPILYGYKHFNPAVHIAGVVFNQVAGESHYSYLQQACKDVGVECLGYLPRRSAIEIPSRHLGLTLDEKFRFDAFTDRIATLIEEFVDVDRLLQLASVPLEETNSAQTDHLRANPEKACEANITIDKNNGAVSEKSSMRIAVARDEAFNFTYCENIRKLEALGEIIYFSPMRDSLLPAAADLVYLPGGYPEFFLEEISENDSMLYSIASYIKAGGKLLAECGGMMYLCHSIIGINGVGYPMVGALKQDATMKGMKLHLGYRKLNYNGMALRGHEFHYSHVNNSLPSETTMYNAKGMATNTAFIRYKNAIASYAHLYWGEQNILDLWK